MGEGSKVGGGSKTGQGEGRELSRGRSSLRKEVERCKTRDAS